MQSDERDPIVSLYCLQLGRRWWETMRRAFVIMSLPNSCWETELHYAQWSLIDDKNSEYVWFILRKFSSINGLERSESPGSTGGGSESEDNNRNGWRQIFFYLHCELTAGFRLRNRSQLFVLLRSYLPELSTFASSFLVFKVLTVKNMEGLRKEEKTGGNERKNHNTLEKISAVLSRFSGMMSFHLHHINVVQA